MINVLPEPTSLRASPISGRRRLTVIVTAATIAVLALAYLIYVSALGGSKETAPTDRKPVMAVKVVGLRTEIWTDAVAASGAIFPWQEASVGTQIGSFQIIDVRVNVGDRVRKGQLLARLNPALLKAEEEQLAAQDAQAQTNDHRARALQTVGAISRQDALRYATEARSARAQLRAKRLEIRYTSIVAPDDGVISARMATIGKVVPAGEELFRLIQRDRLEWRGELTADQLAHVRIGQAVTITLPDGSPARAAVRQLGPLMSEQSRLGIAYADVLPGSNARAGMYAGGVIRTGTSVAKILPASAVALRDGREYVAKIVRYGATAVVNIVAVTVGRRRGGVIEIIQGVGERDRVALQGAAFLNEGDHVRLVGGQGGGR